MDNYNVIIINDNNIRDAVIRERNKEIMEIEKKIGELNDMHKNLALLVEDQKPIIENIESNIINANINTTKGLNEIKKAEYNNRNSCNVL